MSIRAIMRWVILLAFLPSGFIIVFFLFRWSPLLFSPRTGGPVFRWSHRSRDYPGPDLWLSARVGGVAGADDFCAASE
jgi:hypothetical protein